MAGDHEKSRAQAQQARVGAMRQKDQLETARLANETLLRKVHAQVVEAKRRSTEVLNGIVRIRKQNPPRNGVDHR